jgi:hypothetical protein
MEGNAKGSFGKLQMAHPFAGRQCLLEVFAQGLQNFADLMLTKMQAVKGVATTCTLFVMRE